MKQRTATQQVHSAVNDGWMRGGDFFGSILAGTLLGFFADRWLGTEPWLVIAGVLLGSYTGFMRMWQHLREMDDRPPRDR